MTLRVKIDGGARLKKKLKQIPVDSRTGVRKAIGISALQVQSEAVKLIQRGPPRTGVTVKVTKGGKMHTRSAPGEPPKTDTGRLASSIFAELDDAGLSADVGSDIVYAKALEFGTADGTLQARPWLQPTYDRLKPVIRKRILDAVQKALRKSTR